MGPWVRPVAAVVTLLVCGSVSAEPCCLNESCQDLDPVDCLNQGGGAGYCIPGTACGNDACDASQITEILGVRVTKRASSPDIDLTWLADPFSDSYLARFLVDPLGLAGFRAGGGDPMPDGNPTWIPATQHLGVVGDRIAVTFYQVGGQCSLAGGPTGACCDAAQNCVEARRQADCEADGGTYRGDGSDCVGVTCQPRGACCDAGQNCLDNQLQVDCEGNGGTYQGDGSDCTGVTCEVRGACCDAGQNCLEDQTQGACESDGGTYRGDGTDCIGVNCAATGACCDPGPSPVTCTEGLEQLACENGGGLYQGDGTQCHPDGTCEKGSCCDLATPDCQDDIDVWICEQMGFTPDLVGSTCDSGGCVAGACCSRENFGCVEQLGGECEEQIPIDVFLGPGTSCSPTNPCTTVLGACCTDGGASCWLRTRGDCQDRGGDWAGPGISCADAGSCRGACCSEDGDPSACMDGLTPLECENQAGVYAGPGSNCVDGCTGACCNNDQSGDCVDDRTPAACVAGTFGGTQFPFGSFAGVGSSCATTDCTTFGSCCYDVGCSDLTPAACSLEQGTYLGDGTTCQPGDCGSGGCCIKGPTSSDPSRCEETRSEAFCVGTGGTFMGAVSCVPFCEDTYAGACCGIPPFGLCEQITEGFCLDQGGQWLGPGTTCGDC